VAATGVTVTDDFGTLPVNADCPTVPVTLGPDVQWSCRYQRTFGAGETGAFQNRIEATATNAPADDAAATVTVFPYILCAGTDRVVPNLVGLTKTSALAAWSGAGFTSTLTSWSGGPNSIVVTMSRQPFSCTARNSGTSVTKVPTP
jgi:hypothetical protein